ncbi:MAG: ParB/RepB/Spo0J family partition protein [Alphaproteobacteria bacterium]|nr:ParB/RepB/Spo0J family partition protein [Alphaproteobacteria bacterium]
MSVNKHGLGRGLEALLGDEDLNFDITLNEQRDIKTINIELLKAGAFQPRNVFDENQIDILAQSIKENGILQPLLVRKVDDKYEIIAGERRYRAAIKAGLDRLPIIEMQIDDNKALEIALIENIVRQDLNDVEEANGFKQLMESFRYTQEQISKIVGKSRSYITNSLRLLTLPEEVIKMLEKFEISAGHARCLVGVQNAVELALKVVKEGLNVRQTEQLVAGIKNKSATKVNKIKDFELMQIEKSISQKIGLKVQINTGKNGHGRVVLIYKNLNELENIINKLEN